jgi:hypothetical protein
MWGTDMTAALTVEDGQVAVFVAVDHCSATCVGIHAAVPPLDSETPDCD